MKIRQLAFSGVFFFVFACSFVTGGTIEPTSIPSTQTPQPTPTIYVPPGCENTTLATIPAATALAQPTLALDANPEISTDVQQRVFEQVVSLIESVYVYPDYNGQNWPVVQARYRQQIQSGLDSTGFYSAMQAMILELGDEHSNIESPVEVAQAQAELGGNNDFVGVGVYFLPLLEKSHATVVSVFPNSPAEHSGLKAHDSILTVDGLPLVENGTAYPSRMRGPECSVVILTVQSPGQLPRQITLMRQRIRAALPVDARLVPTTDGSRIGYILLPTFFDETISQQVADALTNFGPLDGLILDNRLNGGGSSSVLEPILAYFAGGTLGEFKSRSESRPLTITPNPIHNSQTVPLVVLVGKDTVSFGEIFAGVLQDSGRARIVGEATLGNVETLHGYNLEDGSRLWLAQEIFDPAGSHANWESTGIVPDVEAYADWDTFTFETDPSITAAVKLLGHR